MDLFVHWFSDPAQGVSVLRSCSITDRTQMLMSDLTATSVTINGQTYTVSPSKATFDNTDGASSDYTSSNRDHRRSVLIWAVAEPLHYSTW